MSYDFSFMLGSPQKETTANGNWNSTGTWLGGVVPVAGDTVLVKHDVTLNVTTPNLHAVAIYNGARLLASASANTELRSQHVWVKVGGTYEVVNTNVSFTHTLTILDIAIDTGVDTNRVGNGLAIEGTCHMTGATKTGSVRLAQEQNATDTTLLCGTNPTGWQTNDRLLIPDTHQLDWFENHGNYQGYVSQAERPTMASIQLGNQVTITAGLAYNHFGGWGKSVGMTHDVNGAPTFAIGSDVCYYFPHLGNLTRNVVIRSENASGVRGHVYAQDRADVDFHYVAFQSLGRTRCSIATDPTTNPDGRHSLNLDNVLGPDRGIVPWDAVNGPWQWQVVGCAIQCGLSTHDILGGLAVRSSHGRLVDTVFYNWRGWHVQLGPATYANVITSNFGVQTRGLGQRWNGSGGDQAAVHGHAGVGMWVRTPFNIINNNVMTNNYGGGYGYGYDIDVRNSGMPRVPIYPGANIVSGTEGVEFRYLSVHQTQLQGFSGNEAYGAQPGGFTCWRLGVNMQGVPIGQAGFVLDLRVWNCYDNSIYLYETNGLFLQATVLGDTRHGLTNMAGNGVQSEDYLQKGLVLSACNFQGLSRGINGPYFCDGLMWVDYSYFNCTTDIVWNVNRNAGGTPAFRPKELGLNNCLLGGTTKLLCDWPVSFPNGSDYMKDNSITVYNHQTVQNTNYRVYFTQQALSYVPPVIIGGTAPGPGTLNNFELWNTYGRAVHGIYAPPEATTLAGFSNGLVKSF